MLYKIVATEKHFLLFLKKKSGFKFKKSFHRNQDAEAYVTRYLRRCCATCKEAGFAYKTLQASSDIRNSSSASRIIEYRVCPECRARNRLVYEFAYSSSRAFKSKHEKHDTPE